MTDGFVCACGLLPCVLVCVYRICVCINVVCKRQANLSSEEMSLKQSDTLYVQLGLA